MSNDNTAKTILTLIAVIIGIAVMVGGKRGVAFLFGPSISWVKKIVLVIFTALVILFLNIQFPNLTGQFSQGVNTLQTAASSPASELSQRKESKPSTDSVEVLSQRDPQNYRNPSIMTVTDTTSDGKKVEVQNLACLATVLVMVDKYLGRAGTLIDDYYSDPRNSNGNGPGAISPAYIGPEREIDLNVLKSELSAGRPVILHGVGGQLGSHFVLAESISNDNPTGGSIIIADPWPGKDQVRPGQRWSIRTDTVPLAHPGLNKMVFRAMRVLLVSGAKSKGGATHAR